MSQLFHKSANSISKASIVLGALLVGGTLGAVMIVDRSGYNTRTGTTIPQPVPFSHEHHVSGLGIDCRYCHTAVEKSSSAGLPPTATCYNCHKLIWNDSPMLEPVRESFRTNVPIRWNRVHDLPGFVQPSYTKFNASVALRRSDDKWEVALIGNNLANKITSGNCFNSNLQNGSFLGGQVQGAALPGAAGGDEANCVGERGRELWLRLSMQLNN